MRDYKRLLIRLVELIGDSEKDNRFVRKIYVMVQQYLNME